MPLMGCQIGSSAAIDRVDGPPRRAWTIGPAPCTLHHALGGLLGLVEESHRNLRSSGPDLVAGTPLGANCVRTRSLPIPNFSRPENWNTFQFRRRSRYADRV